MAMDSSNISVHMEHIPETFALHTTAVMLALFCVVGTIGNAVVMLVYIRKRNKVPDKVPASIFILTLACADFCTCVLIVPLTIFMEYIHYQVGSDIACKLYMFLITSNVPFSAFIMAAIAVDRYLRICFPFSNYLSSKGSKITIIILAMVSIGFGIITSLHYGTRSGIMEDEHSLTLEDNDINSLMENSTLEFEDNFLVLPLQNTTFDEQYISQDLNEIVINQDGLCRVNELIFSEIFQTIYHKVYSSMYVIVFFIVLISYILIFKYVTRRRAIKRRMRNSFIHHTNISMTNATSCALKAVMIGGNTEMKLVPRPYTRPAEESNKTFRGLMVQKSFLANIRTAFMLFVVTAVFILTFLPAWLMSHGFINYNIVVFYTYFIYNITNPVIYSFMNPHFRKSMVRLFKC